jgi:hypothetical protein
VGVGKRYRPSDRPEASPAWSSAVEFRFVADGDGTIIRVRHLGLPTEEARWTHGRGWNGYLPRLGAVLQDDDPGEDPVMALAAAFYARDAEAPKEASTDAGR